MPKKKSHSSKPKHKRESVMKDMDRIQERKTSEMASVFSRMDDIQRKKFSGNI